MVIPGSVLADKHAIDGVDGFARHFAIMREHCQHVHEFPALLAQARANNVSAHPHLDLLHGLRQSHQLVLRNLGALLGTRQAMVIRNRGIEGKGKHAGDKQQPWSEHLNSPQYSGAPLPAKWPKFKTTKRQVDVGPLSGKPSKTTKVSTHSRRAPHRFMPAPRTAS